MKTGGPFSLSSSARYTLEKFLLLLTKLTLLSLLLMMLLVTRFNVTVVVDVGFEFFIFRFLS